MLIKFKILVDSNEILYGNDPKFLNQISQISKGVIEEIYKFINPKNQSEKVRFHSIYFIILNFT